MGMIENYFNCVNEFKGNISICNEGSLDIFLLIISLVFVAVCFFILNVNLTKTARKIKTELKNMNIITKILRFTINKTKPLHHHYPYQTICRIMEKNNYKSYLEVGIWEGKTLFNIADLGKDVKCVGVDPYINNAYDGYSHQDKMSKTSNLEFAKIKNKVLKKAKSYENIIVIMQTSENAVELIDNNSLDMVFIDGNHDYNNVCLDIKLWLPKVREGGILCGHDYNFRHFGVVKAVDKMLGCDNVSIYPDPHIWVYRKTVGKANNEE